MLEEVFCEYWYWWLLAVLIYYIVVLEKSVGALSPKGKAIRNHLMGFKVFLERVKRDEVQRRKEEDPEYVDKVLPYIILLGIEDQELNLRELQFYVR